MKKKLRKYSIEILERISPMTVSFTIIGETISNVLSVKREFAIMLVDW